MYIRNPPFTYDPAQADKLLRVIDEQLMQTFRQLPGFVDIVMEPDARGAAGEKRTIL